MRKQFDTEKYIMDRFQKLGEDFWKPEKKLSDVENITTEIEMLR